MPASESSELSRVLQRILELFSWRCWEVFDLNLWVSRLEPSQELDLRWFDNQVLDSFFFWQQWIEFVCVSLARLIGKWYSLTEQFHSHRSGISRKARLHFKFNRWLCSIGEISRGSLAVNRCELNLTTRAILFHWSLFHQLDYSHHRRMFDFSIYASKIITSCWVENGKSPRARSESSSLKPISRWSSVNRQKLFSGIASISRWHM